jgi:hypothetical protein
MKRQLRVRRKHKVHYFIQDWGIHDRESFWWNRGDWRQPLAGYDRFMFLIGTEVKDCGYGASSMKYCRNLKAAMRCARRLRAKGGNPLISQMTSRKGRRIWKDYFLT